MQFLLLGPVEVRDDGRSVPLPRRQQRALLAALLLRAGEVVSIDRLVDELWGENPPASAVGSLQNAVSQLRKTLGPELVRTQPPGYVLAVEPDAVDARRFERLLSESPGLEPAARAAALREALALWRGPALADLADEPWAETEAARLEELRLTALEERIGAELELGRHAPLVAQLEALVAEHPLRERLWRQLALGLYRSGRQAEALEACRSATTALDELGLEPSAELRQLERDILQQSAALAAPVVEVEEKVPAEAAGERRVVTVLAASVPEDEDPDVLRAALARVLEAANAAVDRHGGELERFGPEGLVAVFGANASREDDALRAVRAGVELAEAAGVAVGVATGDAVVADEPRVAGAAVARAAGLARAGAGVLLDPRTFELVREAVTAETAGPLARVLAVEATRPENRLDAPLVGRQAELERLRSAFADAVEQRRCVAATVTGEPGIGKTRLARELVRSLDASVLGGRCAAYGEGATFLPLVDALREVDPAVAEDELVARRIAGLAGAAQEPGSLGESYWAVRRLLEALAQHGPVALVLDDVHWAEPALLDLVEYLRDRVTAAPLLVLCLARPELLDDRPGWAADALRLEPLTEEETRVLVAEVAPLEDEARERIVDLAEGNPLYAQQLAAYAAESGKALEPGAMPATIDAVLAGRLGRLASGERATLQRAAVIGREFSRGAVAALAPPDLAVDAHLLALTRRGFVHAMPDPLPGDDAYRFHHVLLRDAAYTTLTKEQRADLHERAAAWLDRDGPGDDALVGHHLEQAHRYRVDVTPGDPAVGRLAEMAGERLGEAGIRAWQRSDASTASRLLRRAAALFPADDRRRAALLPELALALRRSAGTDESNAVLREALRDPPDVETEMRARIELAHATFEDKPATGDEALALAERAIPVFSANGSQRSLARAWVLASDVHAWRCQAADWQEAIDQALTHYLATGWSPCFVYDQIGAALYYGPTPVGQGIERCRRLREDAPDRASVATITRWLAALDAAQEHYEEARLLLDEVDEIDASLPVGSLPGETLVVRIEVERLSGSLRETERLLRLSAAEHERGEAWPFVATRLADLAGVLVALGELEDAALQVERAQRLAPAEDVLAQIWWRRALARLQSANGDDSSAARIGREAQSLAAKTDFLADRAWVLLDLAAVEISRRERRRAATLAGQALDLFRRKGHKAGCSAVRAMHSLLPA